MKRSAKQSTTGRDTVKTHGKKKYRVRKQQELEDTLELKDFKGNYGKKISK